VLFCSERNAVFARLDHAGSGELHTVAKFRSHARKAAATLLTMAKTTSDPKVAARLIDAAASLQEEAWELTGEPKPEIMHDALNS
jgi:hypothetical protein